MSAIGIGSIVLTEPQHYDFGLGFALDGATVSNIEMCYLEPLRQDLREWCVVDAQLGNQSEGLDVPAEILARESRLMAIETRLAIARRRLRA